jgi:hypothetical protein
MAGVLVHDVSGYTGEKYNLKIPSLTDPANIQEAMMLFHYGIDNYDGSVEPAEDSVFGNLRDFDDRIAQLTETAVVQLEGTENEILSSGSVGFVTLSLPTDLITPGNVSITGSGSVIGNFAVDSNLNVGLSVEIFQDLSVDGDVSLGTASANYLDVKSSTIFEEMILAKKGTNSFDNDTERDEKITDPIEGMIIYLRSTNSQQVYVDSLWKNIEDSGTLNQKFGDVEALALASL